MPWCVRVPCRGAVCFICTIIGCDRSECAQQLPVSPGAAARAAGSARRSKPNARRRTVLACGFAGFLYERGRGVTADAARAAAFYQQSCDAGDQMGCVGFALLQARGNGIPKDTAKAQSTLTELCSGEGARGMHPVGGAFEHPGGSGSCA